MSKLEVNTVAPQCGTTLTLGESGDTVALASGASQTAFCRTGTVDWVTTIQPSTPFTAVSGKGYFVNTTSGAITMNLPSSPSVGDIVAVKDYAATFSSNNLTIGRGGSNMNGNAGDYTATTNNLSLTLVYADATKGWLSVEEGTGFVGEAFVTATGGTESTCGDYKIHTFTSPGTFEVTQTASAPACNAVEYIVTAGGGGAGRPNQSGGGGAGGFRFASPSLAPLTYPGKPLAAPAGITVSVQAYPITVGGGGAASSGSTPTDGNGSPGNDSSFSTITSAGGGGGAGVCSTTNGPSPNYPGALPGFAYGLTGGSGGGSRGTQSNPGAPNPANHYYNPGGVPNAGGAGNTPPVSPSQGNAGGSGYDGVSTNSSGGGGGGAICAGNDARGPGTGTNAGGPGGDGAGIPTAFGSNGQPCGSYRYYAGGGGGGQDSTPGNTPTGGKGGGGNGAANPGTGTAGTANTGGGGGAGSNAASAAGGSGIVIIRYKYQ